MNSDIVINAETVLDHMTESLVLIDPDGKIVFFNKVAESYQALAKVPFSKGISFYDLLSEDHEKIFRLTIAEVIRNIEQRVFEAVFKDPKGNSYFFEISISPISQAYNKVVQVCIVSRDITPQKAFERKSSQLIRELSELIETANAVIFGIDVKGYITEWNNECIRVSGFEREDVFGRKADLVLVEDHVETFNGLLERIYKGESVSNCEFRIKRKRSTPITILLNGTPKRSQAGHVIGALFVGQDVTELTEYRQSLENKVRDRTEKLKAALQKEKELVEIKNRFVSIVSHEFRIPLNGIANSVSSLKKTMSSLPATHLDSINDHVDRMKNLLEDVLTIGKSETHQLNPKVRAVDILNFLQSIIAEVLDATHHTHVVTTQYPTTPVVIETDDKLLRNIFVNLFSNAVKFSPGKKEVFSKLTGTENEILITVQDFGIGIDEKDQERVFEPFNRGSNVGKIKGTGLGLSIVKKAVESLGGKLLFESSVGKGTTFTVVLPKRKE
jgi:PAS domain S-box-containing protein